MYFCEILISVDAYQKQLFRIGQSLLISYLLLFALRVLFLIWNFGQFEDLTLTDVLMAFSFGILYDSVIIAYCFALYVILLLLPFKAIVNNAYIKIILKVQYVLFNFLFIGLYTIDTIAYPFTAKRSSYDFSKLIFDVFEVGPSLVLKYWWVLLFIFLMVYIINRSYPNRSVIIIKSSKNYILLSLLVLLAFLVSAFRGGWFYKPLLPSTVSQYLNQGHEEIAYNAPYIFMYNHLYSDLEKLTYFSEDSVNILVPVKHYFKKSNSQRNVLVFVLESLSQEFVGAYNNGIGFTPFLDSIASEGHLFINNYANATNSINGLAAILASIPPLMKDPFISSKYQSNRLYGIGDVLKPYGYHSSFYHSAPNGSMYFDNLTSKLGFDAYYGLNEYEGADSSFDGTWGIYDDVYMQYWANELSKQTAPFISVYFSIAAHHPFAIPKHLNKRFSKSQRPIENNVSYLDYALKKCFEQLSQLQWFDSSLIVITGDHTSLKFRKSYKTLHGKYKIPLILYSKSDSLLRGINNELSDQLDIIPTILDYIGCQDTIISFGQSLLDTNRKKYVINYQMDRYFLMDKEYLLTYNNEGEVECFNYVQDSFLTEKLNLDSTLLNLEMNLKAYMQQFNQRMISDKLCD